MTRTERQREAVKKWIANKGHASIEAATGFGKTNVGLMTIKSLLKKYPSVIRCIPILLSVRESEIFVLDDDRQEFNYSFRYPNYSAEQYAAYCR